MENLYVLICHLDLPCHPERIRGTSKANATDIQSECEGPHVTPTSGVAKNPTFGNKFKHNRFK